MQGRNKWHKESQFLLTHPVWDVTSTLLFLNKFLCKFLLTHPVWDVTQWMDALRAGRAISTHTSRVGCDQTYLRCLCLMLISTHTSRVGCDTEPYSTVQAVAISTHTSRVGCDPVLFPLKQNHHISTHTSRVGCDFKRRGDVGSCSNFYSHIPCGM